MAEPKTPVQLRLSQHEIATIDAIAKALGLTNRTEAVRSALRQTAQKLKCLPADEGKEKTEKQS